MLAILHQADWLEVVVLLGEMLARMTCILVLCWCIARLLPRHAALRHSVLVAGLLSVLAMPVLVISIQGLNLPRRTIRLPHATSNPPLAIASSDSHESSYKPYRLKQRDSFSLGEDDAGSHSNESHGSTMPPEPEVDSVGPLSDTSNVSNSGVTYDCLFWLGAAFVAVWTTGTTVRSVGLVRSFMHLRHLVNQASVADHGIPHGFVDEFRTRFRFKNEMVILNSAKVTTPVAVGLVRNCIVLPTGLADTLSTSELKAVIFHEAAHLQRRDHIVVLLQEILGTVLWWHPVVLFVNRELTRAREDVCDNYVLRTVDADTYSAALLTVSRLLCPTTETSRATPLWGSHWKLENRVSSILDERRIVMTSLNLRTSAIVSTLCLGISLVLATTGFSLAVDAAENSTFVTDDMAAAIALEGMQGPRERSDVVPRILRFPGLRIHMPQRPHDLPLTFAGPNTK